MNLQESYHISGIKFELLHSLLLESREVSSQNCINVHSVLQEPFLIFNVGYLYRQVT